MRKTTTKLADGRELVYFDSDATATTTDRTTVVDPRDLEPTSTASEIRHDAVLDEWVAIASHRQGRTHLPPADECPLCPSRDARHYRRDTACHWICVHVKSRSNLYELASSGV